MNALPPLPSLIRASAHDAGAMSMRKAGRAQWNDDDWNAMCETQERLIRSLFGRERDHNAPDMCFIRFSVAEQMERAGHFSLRTPAAEISAAVDEALA